MTTEETPVIIVGAGPVGMVLAYQLDRLQIPCFIAEQNLETTRWPKMDLTNCRSMELLRYLGLADDYRVQPDAVNEDVGFDTGFVTQINPKGRLLSSWRLPSARQQRAYIHANNDGSQPAEAEQRCSQIIFEAWLKKIVVAKPHISSRFGWRYLSHREDATGVVAKFADLDGQHHTVRGRYLVGCDGGGSRVRRTAEINMLGGPMPMQFHLVHFKSRELANNLPFGRFWHMFPINGGFLIDQDDDDTFTAHFPVHLLGPDKVEPQEVVYRALGGAGQPHRFKIDEILVDSEWTPNFSVAEQYNTDSLKVFLAGDAAHRNPPHGGYGMNSGVVDAVDLGWRLSAVIKGYGGDLLLRTYSQERRPIMVRALVRAHRHLVEHIKLAQIYEHDPGLLEAATPQGDALREKVHAFLQESGPETLDRGIELDLRLYHSPVVWQDGSPEPHWETGRYVPSTRPGSRAPHVFLKDGTTSIYDLFGAEFTLIHFVERSTTTNTNDNNVSDIFATTAESRQIPLKHIHVLDEPHAHRIWERDLVLVRPDTHVAWRGNAADVARLTADELHRIWDVLTGHVASAGAEASSPVHVANEEAFKKIVVEFLGGGELQGSELRTRL
ncbi:hypothetical protein NUU61_002544 [Penicillium alfredii]|uniref:FAD-binding domain-containing protein n=1 Tax=Penicillium alfredii TaxID=1506179 RepID=A0A9W9KHD3_9EURO|nr:uncharacterized protein NUU61_002544 [Penicillium alfredii]KAJ5105197.1 hypothetical protein NUU61_002544 [Penicillium alfredii]